MQPDLKSYVKIIDEDKGGDNLSVDLTKFRIYNAWQEGLISDDDANKFLLFIKSGESCYFYRNALDLSFLHGINNYNKDHSVPWFLKSFKGSHEDYRDRLYLGYRLLYIDSYIKQTVTDKGLRLVDFTGIEYKWANVFTKEDNGITLLPYDSLGQKDFLPEIKARLAQYMEKDATTEGDQYIRSVLLNGWEDGSNYYHEKH